MKLLKYNTGPNLIILNHNTLYQVVTSITTHAFAHVWSRTHHRTNAFGPPHSWGRTRPLTRPDTGGAYEAPDGLERRWTLCFPRRVITPFREGISLMTPFNN